MRIPALPTIDLIDDEHAAVAAPIRRLIELSSLAHSAPWQPEDDTKLSTRFWSTSGERIKVNTDSIGCLRNDGSVRLLLASAYGSCLGHSARTAPNSGTRASGRRRSDAKRVAIVEKGRIAVVDRTAGTGGIPGVERRRGRPGSSRHSEAVKGVKPRRRADSSVAKINDQ